MKVSELLKILKLHGIDVERHGASHDIYYSPITNKRFSVPRHKSKELPIGTLNRILKDAGIKGV